jgi:gluconolactonase
MDPLLPMERVEVFFDGTFSEPRLRHPEGVAIDKEGNVWCGGEGGEIYRIESDGSDLELVASTEGFTLGLAFDANDYLYTCDLRHASVFRLSVTDGELERFAVGTEARKIRIPNFPVVDERTCFKPFSEQLPTISIFGVLVDRLIYLKLSVSATPWMPTAGR